MKFLAFAPYLLIIVGLVLGFAKVRPAMLSWGACATGVICGLVVAVAIFATDRWELWIYAIIAAVPIAIAVPMVIKDLSYPRINDVTTNVENPPAFIAALKASPNMGRDLDFPEKNGPIIRESYPNLRPLILEERPEQVFQSAERLAKTQSGWTITRRDADKGILEGEAATSFLSFVDDFLIQVSSENGKTRVDMRSKSREGLVDAGKNAKRIEGFFKGLAEYQSGVN